jgi:cytochrome P450
MWIVQLLILAVATGVYFLLTPRRYAPGPVIFPIVGCPQIWWQYTLKGDSVPGILKFTKRYGKTYQSKNLGLWPSYTFATSDPKVIRFILQHSDCFPERPSGVFNKIAPQGMLALPSSAKWKSHRSAMTPSLWHTKILESYAPIINLVAERVVATLTEQPNNEMTEILGTAAHATIGAVGFGGNVDSLIQSDSYITKTLGSIMRKALPLCFIPSFVSSSLGFTQVFHDTMCAIKSDIAHIAISALKQGGDRSPDNILSTLSAQKLGREEILDEVITLMLAGHETVAHTLSWCVKVLAESDEIQNRVFNEVSQALEPGERPTLPMIFNGQFEYLEAFIWETLRMYPTVPTFSRKVVQDVHISTDRGEVYFPTGSRVLINVVACNLSEDNWDDPHRFDPTRFLSLHKDQMHKEKCFYPFGGGTRKCIGKRFALIEVVIFLVHIIHNFELRPQQGAPVSIGKTFVTFFPESGVHLRCIPRHSKKNNPDHSVS